VQRTSDSGMQEAIGGNLGERPAQMKFGMAFDSKRLSGSKPAVTGSAVSSVLGWLAEIGQAAKHLLRLEHPASAGNYAEGVVAEAGAGHAATDNADAEPTAAKSSAATLTVDATVSPIRIDSVGQAVPDAQEIDRRRSLVRTLFNDFWSEADDKPAAFVHRLDQAEDYLNDRLAANGEFWRLDANTRAMLGLPARSSSSTRPGAKA
jgi:hypothetical protein